MSDTFRWKIYDHNDSYIASTRDLVDAIKIAVDTDQYTVRDGHNSCNTVWTSSGDYGDDEIHEMEDKFREFIKYHTYKIISEMQTNCMKL